MAKNKEQIIFRLERSIYKRMLTDLNRNHPFASERVGFLFVRSKKINNTTTILIATDYRPVADGDYIKDLTVGAKINSNAIRSAMQTVIDNDFGCFHVHFHSISNNPSPSRTDKLSLPKVVLSISNANINQLHGFLILSSNSFYCEILKEKPNKFINPSLLTVVGYPMWFNISNKNELNKIDSHNARQQFLGSKAPFIFENIRIGIVGYGGGGSHIGQQLAHIGLKNITVFDFDKIEGTNINRLIGGKHRDIEKNTYKVDIAKRTMRDILPGIKINCIYERWQERPDLLGECDVVIGAVDTYQERNQIEAECRRFLIPYIDIGMDVYLLNDAEPNISGQIMLSMPGMPCMRCMGYLTEAKLAQEARKYGVIGGRPQVVWSNGVLASTAVGILIELLTGWTENIERKVYLAYDGNLGTIQDHVRLKYTPADCLHYKIENAGPTRFKKL